MGIRLVRTAVDDLVFEGAGRVAAVLNDSDTPVCVLVGQQFMKRFPYVANTEQLLKFIGGMNPRSERTPIRVKGILCRTRRQAEQTSPFVVRIGVPGLRV